MNKLIKFLLLMLVAASTHAQQKAPYDRTTTQQTMADRSTWSRYHLSIPKGPTPGFPSYVPDSIKCGSMFYRTTDTTIYLYNCVSGKWDKMQKFAVSNKRLDSLAAAKANVNGPNTFTGPQTVIGTGGSNIVNNGNSIENTHTGEAVNFGANAGFYTNNGVLFGGPGGTFLQFNLDGSILNRHTSKYVLYQGDVYTKTEVDNAGKLKSSQLTLREYAVYKGVSIGTGNDSSIIQQYFNDAGQKIKRIDGSFFTSGNDIPSNTTIEGVGYGSLSLVNSANRPVLQNVNWQTGGLDSNIVIRNLDIFGNGDNQSYLSAVGPYANQLLSGVRLWNVNNGELDGLKVYRTSAFGIWEANVQHFVNRNIFFDQLYTGTAFLPNQDGLHINGPAHDVNSYNVHGRTGDDIYAVNGGDLTLPTPLPGGVVTDVHLYGLHGNHSFRGARLLSANWLMDDVSIDDITGSFRASVVLASAHNEGPGYGGLLQISNVSASTDSISPVLVANNQLGYIIINDTWDHVVIDKVNHSQNKYSNVPTVKFERGSKTRLIEARNFSTTLNKTLSAATSATAQDYQQSDILFAKGSNFGTAIITNHTIMNGTAGKGYGISVGGTATALNGYTQGKKLIVNGAYYDVINRAINVRDSARVDTIAAMNTQTDIIGTPIVVGLATTNVKTLILQNNGWVNSAGTVW